MVECSHVNAADLKPPTPSQSVYREDCTQCFDSIDDEKGLNVCLHCFNGGCVSDRGHARLHYTATKHPLSLNIQRKRKLVARDEPPQKMSKLAIAAETEADRYDTITRVDCFECGQDVDKASGKLPAIVDSVLKANTFAKQEEVKAWEQEMTPCEHTLCLEQGPAKQIEGKGLGQCASCDLKENLWLCLECGNLGCGRAQYGGVGGNSHALAHGDASGHPVAVKLGSLTADGTADIYCYSCNEERIDPELAAHLANFGIDIRDRQKTEKSLTELQIEQNLRWEFSMATADGQEMTPLFGPGFTGLKNLGNSCYLASTLQCLIDIPEFAKRYFFPNGPPPAAALPAEDFETQMRKITDGLLSGRYSNPNSDVIASEDSPEVPHQKGLAPAMLKHLIGRGHAEFSTMRQQDAFEFLLHVLQLIARSSHPEGTPNPVDAFKFTMEQKLQCLACKKVRYRIDEQENVTVPVPIRRMTKMANGDADGEAKDEFEPVTFKECLDSYTAPEHVELTCPACSSTDGFTKQSLFKTFPAVLAINARRFDLVNWLPTKMDVPVIVPEGPISFDAYKSAGLQAGEQELPEEAEAPKQGFAPNATALAQLEGMGFPTVRCAKALKATGNSDAETAMTWLFEHMEDPDIDAPMEDDAAPAGGAGGAIDPEKIENLGAMGFSAPQARQALKETGGDMERAVDWLFSHPDAQGDFGDEAPSADGQAAAAAAAAEKAAHGTESPGGGFALQSIVCHKGSSIHAGHYVAFIKKTLPQSNEKEWVLFNDEKVARAPDAAEAQKFAYVYFLRRQD